MNSIGQSGFIIHDRIRSSIDSCLKHLSFIIWLNWSKLKRSILIGSLSGPILLYEQLRWTAHELTSLISVLEKIFKKRHFGTLFLVVRPKMMQNFCENGVIEAKLRLSSARAFRRYK